MKLATGSYEQLTALERFGLMIEAMAREDEVEADRLEDTCPQLVYRCEDAAFRDRVRRAYGIASMVALNMRAGLTRIRMAEAFRATASGFASPVAKLALAAFCCGRACGREETALSLMDPAVIANELTSNEAMAVYAAEIRVVSGEVMRRVADSLHHAVGQAEASDLLSQWEGFGRFCRETLNLAPLVVFDAFGLGNEDPGEKVRAAWPEVVAVNTEVTRWAEQWTRSWGRGGRGVEG